jgi:hypothetical protein
MGKVIERLCRCDEDRANHLLRALKVWLAYVGILCLGGLIFGTPLYFWFDRTVASINSGHQAEVARLIDVNKGLLVIIDQRLPPLVAKTDAAVQAAQEAVSKAEGASKTAAGAGATARQAATTAKSAANKVSEAAADVKEAVTPQPVEPKDPPDWLGGS